MRALLLYLGWGALIFAPLLSLKSEVSLPDASLLDDSENDWYEDFETKIAHLVRTDDFEGLDQLATENENKTSPLCDGTAAITLFYLEFCNYQKIQHLEPYYEATLIKMQKWSKKRSDSVHAKIALAKVIYAYAIYQREDFYTKSNEKWKQFMARLDEAASILSSVREARKNNLYWYILMEKIGIEQSWDQEKFESIAQEAFSLFPDKPELYNLSIRYHLPHWNGAPDLTHTNTEGMTYLEKSLTHLPPDEGDVFYVRTGMMAWNSLRINIFAEIGFSWPRVSHGMELLAHRYPHSKFLLHNFALFAYQNNDHALTKLLFSHIKDDFPKWSPWNNADQFNLVKAWAQ